MSFLKNLFSNKPTSKLVSGLMDWKFGMSPEEVSRQQWGPYVNVESTGGIMTNSYPFMGKPTPVSFLFNDQGLYRIQVWAYQGTDREMAAKSFAHVWNYMKIQGVVESTGLRLENFSSDQDFINMIIQLLSVPNESGGQRKLQMRVKDVQPENVTIFSSLMDQPEGIFVFLYYSRG